MKPLLFLTLTTAALCAQYVEILGTDYPANSLPQLNKKMASRVGSGAPTGACTPGLDFYLDSATTTAYVCPSGSWAALSGGGGGAVSSVFGRTGAVTAQTGDYTAAQVTNAVSTGGSYADPAWITSLAGSKVSGSISGNAGTATALAANPTNCTSGQLPRGIAANGSAEGCAAVSLSADVSGTLPNSATTAASTNTASAIVARDASGNFSANTITATLSGNASTATTLATPRAINGVSFDGSAPITITANLPSNPAACPGGEYVTDLAADGTLTCGTPAGGGSGTVTSVSVSTGLLSVANSTTTPAISISGTSGGVPYFSAANTLASSAALDAGALVVGGGAGGAPTTLANSSVPNAGELRLSTAPTPGATRSVFALGSAITGGNSAANGGTFYSLNAPTAFIGDFMRFELNGAAAFAVNRLGTITIGNANTYGAAGISISNVGTLAYTNTSSGTTAATRITGSAGTGSGNFLALRPTSGGSGADVFRVNADERGVMIGQTAETTSVTNLSLGVFDDTASTGVTRMIVQKGANQGTVSPLEVRDFNGTLGSGALLFEIEPDGSFRSLPTGTKPTCASGIRGTYWYTQGGTGVKDNVEVCAKDAADAYAWRTIY